MDGRILEILKFGGNLGLNLGFWIVFVVSGDGVVVSPVLGGWVGVAARGWQWAAISGGGERESEDGD